MIQFYFEAVNSMLWGRVDFDPNETTCQDCEHYRYNGKPEPEASTWCDAKKCKFNFVCEAPELVSLMKQLKNENEADCEAFRHWWTPVANVIDDELDSNEVALQFISAWFSGLV